MRNEAANKGQKGSADGMHATNHVCTRPYICNG